MSTLATIFKNIADAIRTKTGKTDLIHPEDFAEEIVNIPSEKKYTGSLDVEGLRSLGYDEETIAWYNSVVDWDEEYNDVYVLTDLDYELAQTYNKPVSCYGNRTCRFIGYSNITTSTPATHFRYNYSAITIPKFNIASSVKSLSTVFESSSSLITVPKFNTKNITDFSRMFYGCTSLKAVPNFDTSKATNFSNMFYNCTSLKQAPDFDFQNVTSTQYMFFCCYSLKRFEMKTRTNSLTNANQMFQYCQSLEYVDMELASPQTVYNMFQGCSALVSVKLNTSNLQNFNGICNNCGSLKSLYLTDCGNATAMQTGTTSSYIPFNCPGLSYISGFKNLGKSYPITDSTTLFDKYNLNLSYCRCLTLECALNIIDDLYDVNSKRSTPIPIDTTSSLYVNFHSNLQNFITEEYITIANNKGWSISFLNN
ncbi:MAG: DUF285 domain-containing protein [Clostridium sp.]|nr:DUF285 domain-containing protein [Clostridium sp.]